MLSHATRRLARLATRPHAVSALTLSIVAACGGAPNDDVDHEGVDPQLASTCAGGAGGTAGAAGQGVANGNLLANPSFETDTSGWSGWQAKVARVADGAAPDGKYAALVTATAAGGYSIQEAVDVVTSAAKGATYAASAYVAAKSTSAVGKPVSLVLREKDAAGNIINESTGDAALTTSFQELSVTGTMQNAGDHLDLYVFQAESSTGDAFYADQFSLTKGTGGGGAAGAAGKGGAAAAGSGGAGSGGGAGGGGAGASGAAMPTGNVVSGGVTWQPVFSEDFTKNAPLGKFLTEYGGQWSAYGPGWQDTSKHGVYDPSKTLSVAGGALDIWVHTENGTHYVSAPVPTVPNAAGPDGGLTYGRYAVRFKADSVAGYKTAWLLWPDSGQWPAGGEDDFPEGDLNGQISAFAHYADAKGGQDAFANQGQYGGSGWHTAVTEWSAGRISFILDGKTIGTSTHEVANHPMHYVMQTETALSGTPPSDAAQGHVDVDWVVIYKPI